MRSPTQTDRLAHTATSWYGTYWPDPASIRIM